MKATILVIEDNEKNRYLTTFILEKHGYQVFQAGDGQTGIALANLFVDRGLLTYVTGQRVPRQEFRADAAKAITKLPLVVTTNGGTADGAHAADRWGSGGARPVCHGRDRSLLGRPRWPCAFPGQGGFGPRDLYRSLTAG